MRATSKLVPIATFAALAMMVTTACGTSGSTSTLGAAQPSGPVAISGGTSDEQALLKSIVTQTGATSLVSVEIGSPPGCPENCAVADSSSDSWLYVNVDADNEEAGVKAQWEALLIVGAYCDQARAAKLRAVSGKTISVTFADGTPPESADTVLDQSPNPDLTASSEDGVTSLIQAAANKADMQVDSISFEQPLGLAPLIVITMADPKSFVVRRAEMLYQLTHELVGPSSGVVDGVYVEVRGNDGNVVTVSAYAVRTHEGVGWTQPDLQPSISIGGSG